MTQDANSFLMGGGVPSAKFDQHGDTVKGVIEDLQVTQQTEFRTNELKFWKDGRPMMQLVVTLRTDDRDPTIEHDTGRRRVFVRGRMQQAVREAVQKAAPEIELGGTLAVQYYGDEPTDSGSPAKLYVAEYRPPSQAAANSLLGAGQPQAQPTQQAAPAQAATPPVGSLL